MANLQRTGATLVIRRRQEFRDRVRKYRVCVDDVEVGRVACGEEVALAIPAGGQSVVLKIDWCRSNRASISPQAGETLAFDCGSGLAGWRAIFAIVYVTFLRNKYLWLRPAATNTLPAAKVALPKARLVP